MSQHSSRWLTLGLMAAALIVFAACGVANAAPAAQETPTPGSTTLQTDIGVNGTGRVFAKPDTALASVGVDITAPTLAQATSDANTRMTAVLAKIKSMGVEDKDITTISYSVNPETSNPKEGAAPTVIAYRVSNIVQIKVRKIDDLGKIIDAAITAGANSLNSVAFTVDDPKSFEAQARAQAVTDATTKAKTLADAAGVKLGKIISLTENISVRPPILFERAALAAPSASGAPGPIETGQNEISVTVEMHFQIVQ